MYEVLNEFNKGSIPEIELKKISEKKIAGRL